jgi:hypothetical protein
MCRSIKTLHNFKPPATDDEIRAASLQFVRKLSGFTRPSKANEQAFDHAVDRVAEAARELLGSLVTNAPARDRQVEASKARARTAARFHTPDATQAPDGESTAGDRKSTASHPESTASDLEPAPSDLGSSGSDLEPRS